MLLKPLHLSVVAIGLLYPGVGVWRISVLTPPHTSVGLASNMGVPPVICASRMVWRRDCFVAPACRRKAKVKLGPTRSSGRDALRRVLARRARSDAGRAKIGDKRSNFWLAPAADSLKTVYAGLGVTHEQQLSSSGYRIWFWRS